MWWSLSNLLWTPKIPECLCALTQTKAVDLSRNLSINCVDLGSSPTRSPHGKSSLSGSGREARNHLRGGGWPQPPANVLLGSLGTCPRSRRASSTWRCCQTSKPFAVLRAIPAYCYSLISQYFLLHVFPYLAQDLRWVCGDYLHPCTSMLTCSTTAATGVVQWHLLCRT